MDSGERGSKVAGARTALALDPPRVASRLSVSLLPRHRRVKAVTVTLGGGRAAGGGGVPARG